MPIGTWSARERNIITEYGYSSESDAEAEEKEVEEERSRSRSKVRRSCGGRGIAYPRPHSHLLRSLDGRRARGRNRHGRRFDNSMYLRTLHQISEEELADDHLHVVPEHDSPFKELFTDNKQRQMWQKFVKLSEEQQQSILKSCEQKKAVSVKKPKPSTPKGLQHVDQSIRAALHNKGTPHDFLDSLEGEIRDLFASDSSIVHVLLQPSSYHRMLTHGVCQYLGLSSKTERQGEGVLVIIQSTGCVFEPPPTFLTTHLRHSPRHPA